MAAIDGSGCDQLAAVFNDFDTPKTTIGGTDIANRPYLPYDILALIVTKPMFEKLCRLDESSFLNIRSGPIKNDQERKRSPMINIKPSHNRPILHPCTLEKLNHQVDPYIGCEHYCYYCYVLDQAETDWRKEILIHADITDRLESELSDISPQTIYLGWHTDPYQPCEAEYRQTRQVLKLLADKGFSANLLTKSDLVLRDMDVLQSMENAAVSVSVAFNDEDVRRIFEANTKATGVRISALQELNSAGIKTSALICPVIPYITDVNPLIDLLVEHTDKIWIYGLSILNKSDRNWQNVKRIVENHFLDLKEPIETVVFSKNHPYWEKLRQELIHLQRDRKLNLSIHV